MLKPTAHILSSAASSSNCMVLQHSHQQLQRLMNQHTQHQSERTLISTSTFVISNLEELTSSFASLCKRHHVSQGRRQLTTQTLAEHLLWRRQPRPIVISFTRISFFFLSKHMFANLQVTLADREQFAICIQYKMLFVFSGKKRNKYPMYVKRIGLSL